MTFYEVLKNLMSETQTTQKELTEKLKIGKNQFKYWERNGNVPKGDILEALSRYFDCSIDYLLGKTNIKKQTTDDKWSDNEELNQLIEVSSSLSPENLHMIYKLAESLAKEQHQEDT